MLRLNRASLRAARLGQEIFGPQCTLGRHHGLGGAQRHRRVSFLFLAHRSVQDSMSSASAAGGVHEEDTNRRRELKWHSRGLLVSFQ